MPTTTWIPSPPVNTFLNIGADVGFGSGDLGFVSDVMHSTEFFVGSAAKGITDGIIYVMFEVQEPIGTLFTSIQFALFTTLTFGTPLLSFWFGFLSKDGKWNLTTETFTSRGIGNYLLKPDLPQPTSEIDSLWASGAASMIDTFIQTEDELPRYTTFGSVGSGSDYEDTRLLVDFQSAFIDNESDRTVARGVPIMLFMRPQFFNFRVYGFETQNSVTPAERPTLTLGTTSPDVSTDISVTVADASIIATKPSVVKSDSVTESLNLCPQNSNLCFVRGDSRPVRFTFFDPLGVVIDPTGSTFVLTVDPNKNPEDDLSNVLSIGGLIQDQTVVFILTQGIGHPIEVGMYFYDVQQTTSGGEIRTVASGEFEVVQDITK